MPSPGRPTKGRSIRRSIRITPLVASWLTAETERQADLQGKPVSVDDLVEDWALAQIAATRPAPERIYLFDVDPSELVGLAHCDDGEGGWVVMRYHKPTRANSVVIAPLADEHGELVYCDIQDAAAVLRTGKVWRHDMGEGEPDDAPQPRADAATDLCETYRQELVDALAINADTPWSEVIEHAESLADAQIMARVHDIAGTG